MLEKYNFIFFIFLQTLCFGFTIDHTLIDSYRPKSTALIKSYEKILKMSLKSLYSEDERQNNITSQSIITTNNCTIPFEKFSAFVVNFTSCAVKHARPIHICVECGNVYNDTVKAYNDLKKPDECREYFFSSDQVVIVDIIYKEVTDLWSKNYCENCYQSKCLTQEFFETYEALNKCVNSNKSESLLRNAICEKCQDLYANLSNIYSCFIKFPHACMDVVDTMNMTFKLWKKKDCIAFDTHVDYLSVIVAFTICVTPMLFYLLAKNVSIIEDIKIVRPKRKFTTIVTPELTTSEGENSNVTAQKS